MVRDEETSTPLTQAGLEALQAELKALKTQRPAMVERVASARSDGDLKENFAYHDARRDLGMLDGRVGTIESILVKATVIDESASDGTARLGSKVVVRDDLGETTYTLVGPAEVDLARSWISHQSPLGAALLGHRAGDQITFSTPGGERTAEIIKVE